MKTRSLSFLMLAGLPLAAAAATPQGAGNTQPYYRDGQPAVVTPPPSAPADDSAAQAATNLRKTLGRSGSPRFVLMWNRQLSDALTTEYESVKHASQSVQTSPRSASIETDVRTSTHAVREQESSALTEDDDWQVRGDFESWLLDSGMNLVDRNAALRQAGIKLDSTQPNAQQIEMEAISKYADYILEVLSTPANGPADARFRVRITEVKSGRTVVGFSSTGAGPERTTSGYVATDSGFRRVTQTETSSINDVGTNVAVEVAQRLSRALTR